MAETGGESGNEKSGRNFWEQEGEQEEKKDDEEEEDRDYAEMTNV